MQKAKKSALHMIPLDAIITQPIYMKQRQTGISVSYPKHRYQGLWYQYQLVLIGAFLGSRYQYRSSHLHQFLGHMQQFLIK